MEHHWQAFSFVDRITAHEAGGAIRGIYTIPSALDSFPLALAGEAVGQLAAWGAMAAVHFERRPVAGIAGRIEFLGEVRPGQVLELVADLETVDLEAASYSGSAAVNGSAVIRLEHCVGPMLSVAELDDPKAVRDRYALLCGAGASAGLFRGLPEFRLERQGGDAGKSARATLAVPAEAALFADHFPRRPVFPGSLLMQATMDLVKAWQEELPPPAGGGRWRLGAVSDMKFRAFVTPGSLLELDLRLTEVGPAAATVTLDARARGRVVGAARAKLVSQS